MASLEDEQRDLEASRVLDAIYHLDNAMKLIRLLSVMPKESQDETIFRMMATKVLLISFHKVINPQE